MTVTNPSVSDVRAVISTGLEDDQVTVFINSAALSVEVCVSSMADARATEIIRWYAAHLISLSGNDRGSASLTSKKLGDASKSWSKPALGDGALSTVYGQQAAALDPNGCILRLGKRPIVVDALI